MGSSGSACKGPGVWQSCAGIQMCNSELSPQGVLPQLGLSYKDTMITTIKQRGQCGVGREREART